MAAVAPNYTPRLWVKYDGPAGEHEVQFRYPSATGVDAMVADAADVCASLKAFLTTSTTFVSARLAQAGSNLSFPVAWVPIVGTSADALPEVEYPNFVSWVGRGTSGRRVRLTLNGVPIDADSDYRILESENAAVAAVLTKLRAGPVSQVAIDATPIVWNPYANLGRNAYFQRKRRRVA